MKKLLTWSMPLLILIFVLAGCNTMKETPKTNNEQQEETTKTTQQYPIKMKDSEGEMVEFTKQPKRIVSLIPSNTEIIYALGSGESVVGVSDVDTYPKEVADKEKIGGMEFNLEKIISLKPDLVLAHETIGENADVAMSQLEQLGITVFYVPEAKDFDETYDTITQIGLILNKPKEAEKVISKMQKKVTAVQAKVKTVVNKRSAFVETSDAPEIYTAGTDTFIQEMFDLLGITNVSTKSGWYQMNSEAIIKANPDVILVMYDYVPDIVNKVKNRSGFDNVDAVINNHVIQIDSDKISRTGPRLADGLEEVAEAVYPEVFK